MRISAGARRGFTLVELLVVVGLVALLAGLLLPVLSGVSRRGRQLKCQANLRTCVQLFLTYAAENKGSLPYGWYYNQSNPRSWEDDGDGRRTNCFALISRMADKHYKGDDLPKSGSSSLAAEDSRTNYAPFLRCPEAEQVGPHICSYVVQLLAFITPYHDRQIATFPWPIQYKPANLNQLMPFTILIHDSSVHSPGMAQEIRWINGMDVDAQTFWRDVLNPQRRYYEIHDRYANTPSPAMRALSNNAPLRFIPPWLNIDPPALGPGGFNSYYYQGNLRFRHGRNDTVNVAYADGRVEAIKATFNPDQTMKRPGIPRKSFMIKWPTGMGLKHGKQA